MSVLSADIGLTLAEFPAPEGGPRRHQELREQRRDREVGHLYLSARRMAAPGDVRSQAVRADRIPRADELDRDEGRRHTFSTRCSRRPAQVTDKLAICRSMTHGEAAHERGTHNMFTGYKPSPALAVPQHGQRGDARVPAEEQPAAVRLHSRTAQRVCRHGLPQFGVRAVQPGFATRPTPRLHGERPQAARRRR